MAQIGGTAVTSGDGIRPGQSAGSNVGLTWDFDVNLTVQIVTAVTSAAAQMSRGGGASPNVFVAHSIIASPLIVDLREGEQMTQQEGVGKLPDSPIDPRDELGKPPESFPIPPEGLRITPPGFKLDPPKLPELPPEVIPPIPDEARVNPQIQVPTGEEDDDDPAFPTPIAAEFEGQFPDAVGSGAECFPGYVLVRMADNSLRPIRDVRAGDLVRALDWSTGLPVSVPVIETVAYRRPFRDALCNINSVLTTSPHPWAIGEDKWREAGKLRTGDEVLDACGQRIRVVVQPPIPSREPVYNLHVREHHNFVVSDGGKFSYLVHNGGAK